MHRKPSHFGSNDSPPYFSGSGMPLTDLASIGRTGGHDGEVHVATLARVRPSATVASLVGPAGTVRLLPQLVDASSLSAQRPA